LNEAASVVHGLWALDQGDDGAIIFTSALQRLDREQNAGIGRSNRRVFENELLLVAEVD
jgi:hypothetical protein